MLERLHLAACLYMTGVICLIQGVHYPAFLDIDRARFSAFSRYHRRRMAGLVMPVMLLELVTGVLLFRKLPDSLYTANLVGLVLIWCSTMLLSVPCHKQLEKGYDEETVQRLIRTNWPRTILWTTRAVLLVAYLPS